jgi:lipoate-protein ligase B
MARELSVLKLGRRDYASALALQNELHAARVGGEIGDTLILLEHDPVITLGRAAKKEHVLATPQHLASLGIELHEIGRGGDVTYHGPGQLVAYPILDLRPDRCDVRRYVRDLERVMIEVAESYDVVGRRVEGVTGAFVDDRKFGALGVRISRWVTMHGIAINVSTDLNAFQLIVPCGLPDTPVTSLSREANRAIDMDDATARTASAFARVFDYTLR